MDENRMVITDENGNEHLVEILFTYHSDERNKDYVIFYELDNPDEVMAYAYNEDHELIELTDEEYSEVEEVLNAFQDEGDEDASDEDDGEEDK